MRQTSADAALSEEWLARTDQTLAFYRNLRDEFEPGKPMWGTETVDHSPKFAPVLHPTLRTGVETLVVATRAWLPA
jgi:hypothetical protein